jgi:O-antigen/teichoic acid export membrane protein
MIRKLSEIFIHLDPRTRSDTFRRSANNAAWSSVEYAVLPFLWIFAFPVFVSTLGIETFGIWMLGNTFAGFSGMFAFGLGDATVKFISKYRALNDKQAVLRIASSTLLLYAVLGGVVALLAYGFAPFLVRSVFTVPPEHYSLAITVLRLSGIGVAARFVDSVFISVFQGYERYDLTAGVTIPTNIITVIANVCLVLLGYGVDAIMMSSIALLVASSCVRFSVLRVSLSLPLTFLMRCDRATLRELWSYGVFSWMQGLSSILLNHVDRLLIASLLNTSFLGYYSVCLQLAQQIHSLLARGFAFLFPLASGRFERGDTQGMKHVYFRSLRLVTTMAVSMGFPLFLFADSILTVWMGKPFADEAALILRILALSFTILATSIVPYYYMNGTGYVRMNTAFGFVSGTLVALATIILAPSFGLAGAACARLANIPTGVLSRVIMHTRVLGDRRWYSALLVLAPVAVMFLVGIVLIDWGIGPFLDIPLLTVAMAVSAIAGATGSYLVATLFPLEPTNSPSIP